MVLFYVKNCHVCYLKDLQLDFRIAIKSLPFEIGVRASVLMWLFKILVSKMGLT